MPFTAGRLAPGRRSAWSKRRPGTRWPGRHRHRSVRLWNTDSSGNFVSNNLGNLTGASAALAIYEPSFHQDLNGDGVIGVVSTTIQPRFNQPGAGRRQLFPQSGRRGRDLSSNITARRFMPASSAPGPRSARCRRPAAMTSRGRIPERICTTSGAPTAAAISCRTSVQSHGSEHSAGIFRDDLQPGPQRRWRDRDFHHH